MATVFNFQANQQAIEYVHSQSLLHLDIKPGNICRPNLRTFKLLDFGTCATHMNGNPIDESKIRSAGEGRYIAQYVLCDPLKQKQILSSFLTTPVIIYFIVVIIISWLLALIFFFSSFLPMLLFATAREVMEGEGAAPASDVYALGLTACDIILQSPPQPLAPIISSSLVRKSGGALQYPSLPSSTIATSSSSSFNSQGGGLPLQVDVALLQSEQLSLPVSHDLRSLLKVSVVQLILSWFINNFLLALEFAEYL
jgi:serine/threonine protein kinase